MWHFCSFYDGVMHRWSWRRYSEDALALETAPTFKSVAEAFDDAHRHGFEVSGDRWEIRTLAR